MMHRPPLPGEESVKRFERSNGLDTALYKTIPLPTNIIRSYMPTLSCQLHGSDTIRPYIFVDGHLGVQYDRLNAFGNQQLVLANFLTLAFLTTWHYSRERHVMPASVAHCFFLLTMLIIQSGFLSTSETRWIWFESKLMCALNFQTGTSSFQKKQ